MARRSYDPMCEELAAHFLSDVESDLVPHTIGETEFNELKAALSQKLQEAAEDWLSDVDGYFSQKRMAVPLPAVKDREQRDE